MHCNDTILLLLTLFQELINNMRGRGGPIIKNHIKVCEAKVDELPGIIYLSIEAYNCGNVHFL